MKIFYNIIIPAILIINIYCENSPAKTNEIIIDEQELLSATNEIEFENFSGYRKNILSAEAVIELGRKAAAEMISSGEKGGNPSRYAFYRFVPDNALLGADLLVLGKKCGIMNIISVRRLLTGYLQQVYAFNEKRADSLAFFILIYNALRRADNIYVKEKYSSAVGKFIPQESIGIDRSYRNWPGNTFVIIPTSLHAGNISVREIASEATAKAAEGGENLAERSEMIKLRKEQAAEETRQIIREENKIAEEEKKIQTALSGAGGQEIESLKKETARLQEKKETLEDKKIALDEEKEKIRQEETQIVKDAEKLAADTRKKEDDGQSALSMGKIYFIKTIGTGKRLLQQVYLINPVDDTVIKKLGLPNVCGLFMNTVEGDPLVIMNDERDANRVFLARIDIEKETIKNQSAENIFSQSKIWINENFIYAIGLENNKPRLIKFNPDLSISARSDVDVFPDTQLTFFLKKIYCTVMEGNRNAAIMVLDENLKKIIRIN